MTMNKKMKGRAQGPVGMPLLPGHTHRAITFFGTHKPSCLDATVTGLLDRQLIFAFQVKISISAGGHKS
jgi:hypothetical protein